MLVFVSGICKPVSDPSCVRIVIELESSLHQFNPNHFGRLNDFLSTSMRRERDTLMIACSDHATAPQCVSFAGPERFCILQHLAASIPPTQNQVDHLLADVQFALRQSDIRQIILCGHLGCGIIPYWLQDKASSDRGGLRASFRSTVVTAVEQTYPHLTDQQRIERMICEHALFQLENLQTYPFVRDRLASDELKLHLWIVNDQTARVLSFDPCRGNLVPIETM